MKPCNDNDISAPDIKRKKMINPVNGNTGSQITGLHCHELVEQPKQALDRKVVQDMAEGLPASRDDWSAECLEIIYEFDPTTYLGRRC